jgi:hypothetical protein
MKSFVPSVPPTGLKQQISSHCILTCHQNLFDMCPCRHTSSAESYGQASWLFALRTGKTLQNIVGSRNIFDSLLHSSHSSVATKSPDIRSHDGGYTQRWGVLLDQYD